MRKRPSAQKLLEEGNALFLKKDYAQALEKYKAAVGSWDHPAIRFNMVRCLIQLDRPVDASDNLALALKYGAAPLEEAVYTEALSYQKLLANQIGDLDVTCEQAGVKVTLDGQPLLDCPGKEHRRVAPGQHQLVGTEGRLSHQDDRGRRDRREARRTRRSRSSRSARPRRSSIAIRRGCRGPCSVVVSWSPASAR